MSAKRFHVERLSDEVIHRALASGSGATIVTDLRANPNSGLSKKFMREKLESEKPVIKTRVTVDGTEVQVQASLPCF